MNNRKKFKEHTGINNLPKYRRGGVAPYKGQDYTVESIHFDVGGWWYILKGVSGIISETELS
jgi:hypothetical protein